jgi:UDP-N-acetylmuramate dehydrogenase
LSISVSRLADLQTATGCRQVAFEEPLSKHTTLKIGGPAAAFVTAETGDELKAVLTFARSQGIPWKIIGLGSNLLISDQGFPGIVVKLGAGFNAVTSVETALRAGGGVRMADAIEQAGELGLGGIEFLWGIPGTLGGGLRTNAGAFEHELGDLVVDVRVTTSRGEELALSRRDLKFAYRRSALPDDCVVTGVTLKLKRSTADAIASRLEECRKLRAATQPRGASAGSVFRNPKGESAGRLLDQAGLKGRRVGGAVVSERHANFIINEGGARCADVRQLIEIMKQKVEEKFGVILEEEIEVVSG